MEDIKKQLESIEQLVSSKAARKPRRGGMLDAETLHAIVPAGDDRPDDEAAH